jgi:YD repeat-containing protein
VARVDALANRTSRAYDAAGQQVRITDALGNITTSLYDVDGRLLASINALGFRTTQIFDAIGQRLAVIDAKGHRIRTVTRVQLARTAGHATASERGTGRLQRTLSIRRNRCLADSVTKAPP